jgi:hypothetical protein
VAYLCGSEEEKDPLLDYDRSVEYGKQLYAL